MSVRVAGIVFYLAVSTQLRSQQPCRAAALPLASQPNSVAALPRSNQTQAAMNSRRVPDSTQKRAVLGPQGAGWITQVLALITGLFGGFGGVTLWEVVIRPSILRKRVGKVLEIEIGQNLSRIVHARAVTETHGKIRIDLKLSRLGFDAVSSDLAVLPSKLIEDVVDAYLRFQYLTQMSDSWQEWEVQRSLATDVEAVMKLTTVINASIKGYDATMRGALNSAAQAMLALCPMIHGSPLPFKTPAEYVAYIEQQTDVKNAEVAPLHPPCSGDSSVVLRE